MKPALGSRCAEIVQLKKLKKLLIDKLMEIKRPLTVKFMNLHNFMPVNGYTMKIDDPAHHLQEVVDTLITPGFGVYSMFDASNSYWAIPM